MFICFRLYSLFSLSLLFFNLTAAGALWNLSSPPHLLNPLTIGLSSGFNLEKDFITLSDIWLADPKPASHFRWSQLKELLSKPGDSKMRINFCCGFLSFLLGCRLVGRFLVSVYDPSFDRSFMYFGVVFTVRPALWASWPVVQRSLLRRRNWKSQAILRLTTVVSGGVP